MNHALSTMRSRHQGERAFTLIEILTVLCIILILSTLLISAYTYLQSRADRASCINNLQGLYTAANAYLVDHDYVWPQIPKGPPTSTVYAQAWIDCFTPYHVAAITWLCPTAQRQLGNPNYLDPHGMRVDYVPMPFSADKYVAYRWATQPWFVENAGGHGDGPLLVLSNGQILSLNQATLLSTQMGN